MTIYQKETKHQPYVYKFTEISTGKWYIGVRTAKNCHPEEKNYYTSSDTVKPMIKDNPNNWVKEILFMGSIVEAREKETELLVMLDAANDDNSYNKHNADSKWHSTGKPNPLKGRKLTPEMIKRIVMSRLGYRHSEETKEKLRKPKSPRSQETIHNYREYRKSRGVSDETKERISKKQKGNKYRVGTKHTAEAKAKISARGKAREKLECIFCGVFMEPANFHKHHGNNCKLSPYSTPKLLHKCEYCNKEMDYSNYKRWHGENCKYYDIQKWNILLSKIPKTMCIHCGKTVDNGNYAQSHGDKCKHKN